MLKCVILLFNLCLYILLFMSRPCWCVCVQVWHWWSMRETLMLRNEMLSQRRSDGKRSGES